MSVVKIGSTDLPTPTNLEVGVQDINKAQRNTRGTMIIERIATKQKLTLSWSLLKDTDLKSILNAVSTVSFTVTYTDPVTNSLRTGNFYCGDRKAPVLDVQNGVTRYKDIQFDLIEM